MNTIRKVVIGSVAGVALAGGALGLVATANAATNPSSSTPSSTTSGTTSTESSATESSATGSSASTTPDPHPGDNGADGVPESQEVHGGHGGGLDLSGTVTAVGSASVTIKTSSGTKTYAVTSTSDIDKNGEAALKDLAVGDAVTFSVEDTSATTIDKLHAGDEAKDMPQAPAGSTSSSSATQSSSST